MRPARRLLPALALSALLGATACTDRHGRFDPLATGLLGAGVGAAAGLAIGAASARPARRHHHAPPHHGWGRPIHSPRHGWGREYGWGHPRGW